MRNDDDAILEQALRLADAAEWQYSDGTSTTRLIEVLAQTAVEYAETDSTQARRWLEKAFELAQESRTSESRASRLQSIVSAAAEVGNWSLAYRAAQLDTSEDSRARSLAYMLWRWHAPDQVAPAGIAVAVSGSSTRL